MALDDKVAKTEKQFQSAIEKGQQVWETSDHAPKEQHPEDLMALEDVRYLFTEGEQSAETEAHHKKSDSNMVVNQLKHNMAAMPNQGGHFSEVSDSMPDKPFYLAVVNGTR